MPVRSQPQQGRDCPKSKRGTPDPAPRSRAARAAGAAIAPQAGGATGAPSAVERELTQGAHHTLHLSANQEQEPHSTAPTADHVAPLPDERHALWGVPLFLDCTPTRGPVAAAGALCCTQHKQDSS
jgi:hypothetical protein